MVPTKQSLTDTRVPMEIGNFVKALGDAVTGALDARATAEGGDEMYAVFDLEETVTAIAFLYAAFARSTTHLSLTAQEQARRIVLILRGKPRGSGEMLSSVTALFPERSDLRTELLRLLRENGAALELCETEEERTLMLALPRLLTDNYDVCAVKSATVFELFFDALCRLHGVKRRKSKLSEEELARRLDERTLG